MIRTRRTRRPLFASGELVVALLATLTGAATGQITPAPGVATPTAIPVSAIAVQAEVVHTELRSIKKNLAPDPAVQAAAAALPNIVADLDALQASIDRFQTAPVDEDLVDDVAVRAKALKGTLANGLMAVTRAAARLDDDLTTLNGIRQVWEATANDLHAASAPEVVVQQLSGLLDEIGALQRQVETKRAQRLVVQDGLTRQGARADQILEHVALLRAASVSRLFDRSHEPVWRTSGEVPALGDLPAVVAEAVARNSDLLRDYARTHSARLWLNGMVYAALVLLLWRARRGIAQLLEQEPALAYVQAVVEHPFAAAFVASIVGLRLLHPDAPRALPDVFSLVAVVALIRVGRYVLDRRLLPATYVLLGLAAVQALRQLIGIAPLQRVFLFVELPVAIVLFVSLLRRLRAATEPADAHRVELRGASLLLEGLVGVCGLALGTTILGYVAFARFLTERALFVAAVAVALLIAYRVLQGVVAIVLRVRRVSGLSMVRHHRAAMERRWARILTVVLVLFWLWRCLVAFDLDAAFFGVLTALLGATFTYRAFALSLGDVLAVAIVIWSSFRLSVLVRFILEEDVFPRMWLERGKAYALSSLLHYTIVTLGFLVALAFLGFGLDRFAVLAGAFGVGIGFGMQAIVNNFVSGLILLFERPLRINDRVQIGDVMGEIKRIGFRSSTVRTFEGAELIVPNAILVSETVTNWTLSDRLRRIDIQVGVAYGTNVRRVLDLLLEVARQHAHVIDNPSPVSLFLGFGDSSLNFELRAWTERVEDWFQIRSELTVGISDATSAAGIEIPFPQRDVHLTSRAPVDVRVVDPRGPAGRE
jgi:potassium efflux system protein